jgi:hypothetical protein
MQQRSATRRPLAWWLVLLLAVPIVGYALAYVILGERVYPPNLAASFLAAMGDLPTRVLWLPLLILAFGDFTPAYQVVSWLSWVPNLLWAEWHARRTIGAPLPAIERLRVA